LCEGLTLQESIKSDAGRPTPPTLEEEGCPPFLSLVDWRWARIKGFYDAESKQWNEAKGGVSAYLKEIQRRRKVKRRRGNRGWGRDAGARRSKKFEGAMAVAMMRTLRGPDVDVEGARTQKIVEAPCAVFAEMNFDGLEPIDLFSGGEYEFEVCFDGYELLRDSEQMAACR
jgi:hypothetical protein